MGLVFGALALYACSTYSEGLLSGAVASAGTSPGAGGAGTGGSSNTSGSAGTLVGGGAPPATAGSIGIAGDDSAGDAGTNSGGSVAGSAPGGAGSVGVGGNNTSGGGMGGTGGTGTAGGGSAGTGAVAGAAAGAPAGGSGGSGSLELIDDFEDLNKFVSLSHGRNGPWYVFNDGTTGGMQSAFTIAAVTGAGDSPGSVYGLHMTGAGFTLWGAGEGADFVNMSLKKALYDASAYSGVSFYAKIGVAGATTAVNVLFPDIYSDPDGGKCSGTGTSQCSDHLFLTVTGLKTTWAVYQVQFSKLGQVGYGLPQSKLDAANVYSVQFTQSNTLPIDLWIDDLSFIVK